MTKKCHRCGKVLDVLDFHHYEAHKDGLQDRCKVCQVLERAEKKGMKLCPRCNRYKKVWSQDKEVCMTCQIAIENKIMYGDV